MSENLITPNSMDNRLTELEIKVAYQDDIIQSLDQVVCRQQDQIDKLTAQLGQLKERFTDIAQSVKDNAAPADEIPPHY